MNFVMFLLGPWPFFICMVPQLFNTNVTMQNDRNMDQYRGSGQNDVHWLIGGRAMMMNGQILQF